jgi:hypothetical protein
VCVVQERGSTPPRLPVSLERVMIGWINLSVEAFIRDSFGDDAWAATVAKVCICTRPQRFSELSTGPRGNKLALGLPLPRQRDLRVRATQRGRAMGRLQDFLCPVGSPLAASQPGHQRRVSFGRNCCSGPGSVWPLFYRCAQRCTPYLSADYRSLAAGYVYGQGYEKLLLCLGDSLPTFLYVTAPDAGRGGADAPAGAT